VLAAFELAEFAGELDALGFAAREDRRRMTELEIAVALRARIPLGQAPAHPTEAMKIIQALQRTGGLEGKPSCEVLTGRPPLNTAFSD